MEDARLLLHKLTRVNLSLFHKLCAALLALGCEALQRHLPTRTPEVTAVLVALAMGWLVGACRVRRGGWQPCSRHQCSWQIRYEKVSCWRRLRLGWRHFLSKSADL